MRWSAFPIDAEPEEQMGLPGHLRCGTLAVLLRAGAYCSAAATAAVSCPVSEKQELKARDSPAPR